MILKSEIIPISIIFIITIIAILLIIFGKKHFMQKRKAELLKKVKIGEYILTMTGICGKVLGIKQNENFYYVLLQTGDETHKSYITVDIDSIYSIIKEPKEIVKDEIKVKEVNKNDFQ